MQQLLASVTRARFGGWVVLTAVALPYFIALGGSSLWDSSEAFYAETPREMLEAGDYVAPRFNYQIRAQKPPLAYWVVLLSYRLFGVSEFAVRLPGALAALGVLAFTYGIGRVLQSPLAGSLAVAIVAMTPRVFILARRLPIDILLLLVLTGCGYFLARIVTGTAARRHWVLLYVLLGLGFLTKGPVAWAIPGLTYFVAAFALGRFSLRAARPLLGLAVIAAIVLPWYVLIYRAHGWTYIAPFLLRDNLSRFAGEDFGPARGPFYYVTTYAADFFPWSIVSVPALYGIWLRRRELRAAPGLLLPAVWCAVTFVLFSVARNKQEYYIAPIYPMMAVLVGGALERTLFAPAADVSPSEAGRWARWWAWTLLAISLVLFAAGLVALGVLRSFLPEVPTALHILPFGLLAIASLALATQVVRRRPQRAAAHLLLVCWGVFLLIPAVYLRALEPYRPVKQLCGVIAGQAASTDQVGYYRAAFPSMAFYLRRPIFEEFDPEAMVRRFQSGERVYCILTEADYNYFVGSRDLILYVLDRRVRLITQLRLLVDEESWAGQELLLVSNRPNVGGGTREGREIP